MATPISLFQWDKRISIEWNYPLVVLDINVATLILDGEALFDMPWDVLVTIPSLATAVNVAPTMNSIDRVHRSKQAYCWLMDHKARAPMPCLRPKITNQILQELKASKQVLYFKGEKTAGVTPHKKLLVSRARPH